MPRFQPLPVLPFSIPYINKGNNSNTVDGLLSVDVDTTWPRSLLEAAAHGDLSRLQQCWQQGIDMNASFGPGELSLLHYSASKGHLSCVRFLIDKCKVTVDTMDREGETPLLKASYAGHYSVVRYLVLEAGANVFHQDKDGWSALHNACSQGGLAMVQLLLDHDSNVNLQSAMNHTPLINAASKGHLAIVQHLLNTANADPFCRNKFDESAYDAAAVAGEGYICKQLEVVERAKMEQEGLSYQLLKQHSTIPVTIYEYQQQQTTSHSFTSTTIWEPHHSSPWMTPSGESIMKNQVRLPPLTDQQVWIWLTDWIIDYTYPNSDTNGWEYAKQMDTLDDDWTKKPPTATAHTAIRRRRWIRIMTRRSTHALEEDDDDDYDDDNDDTHSLDQDSHSIEQAQLSSLRYPHEEASRPTSSTSITRASAAFVSGSTVLDIEQDQGIVSTGRTLTLERLSQQGTDRVWEKNENALDCRCCGRWFNIISRRHHCRCSTNRAMLPYSGIIHDPQLPFDQVYKSSLQPQRICDPCFDHLARPHTTTTPLSPLGSTATPRDYMPRADSMDSVMMYCPVCGKHLDVYGSTDEQERHVQSCLNAGFSSASLTATGYVCKSGFFVWLLVVVMCSPLSLCLSFYAVYQAPPDSSLLGQECIICFEEFGQGKLRKKSQIWSVFPTPISAPIFM
ncbi:hypothetical protein [Absidia glauca]|uniref:FYVE zinc finger domain-containing protein n=1 Tax=Absidia glauca TaxID=4829 RepID=A0A168Q5R0_ABSGL|nr:hypothetical protein [Absidia glauca]